MDMITIYDGDPVERDNGQWIQTNLSQYEELWSRFIGHDGKGKPVADIGDLGDLTPDDRERFYQAHYSLLVTLLLLQKGKDKLQGNMGQVTDSESYISLQGDLTCFMAHVGRVRDMFKKMDGALGLDDTIWRRFDLFYSERSAYLHGPISSQLIEDGMLKIPNFGNEGPDGSVWTDESRWSDSNFLTFKFAEDFASDTLTSLLALCQGALADCLDRIKVLMKRNPPKLPAPATSSGSISLSATNTLSASFSATNQKTG